VRGGPLKVDMVEWDSVADLGKVPDCDIARRFEVSQTAVLNARRSRGIPPFRTIPSYNIEWDSVGLGDLTDQHLADILGCSKGLVHKERRRRNIPPYGMLYRTSENQGAYYDEAIIDAWLHARNVPHEFQKQIGPFRVDWLLAGNEIWEYLGMWDHQIYGPEYQTNFAKKLTYLESLGFSVRGIHTSEIGVFKSGVDLTAIHSLGRFVCSGCNRTDVKHHAFGLCSRCVGRKRSGVDLKSPVTPRLTQNSQFKCSSCPSVNRNRQVRGQCSKCYAKRGLHA
jgi:hypothetical protein